MRFSKSIIALCFLFVSCSDVGVHRNIPVVTMEETVVSTELLTPAIVKTVVNNNCMEFEYDILTIDKIISEPFETKIDIINVHFIEDDQKIEYTLTDGIFFDVYEYNIEYDSISLVEELSFFENDQYYSPQGEFLIYSEVVKDEDSVSSSETKYNIILFDVRSGDNFILLSGLPVGLFRVDWADDGSRALIALGFSPTVSLYVVETSKPLIKPLKDIVKDYYGETDFSYRLSPDGSFLAYVPGGELTTLIVDLNAEKTIELSDTAWNYQWSNQSEMLFYWSGESFFDLNGKEIMAYDLVSMSKDTVLPNSFFDQYQMCLRNCSYRVSSDGEAVVIEWFDNVSRENKIDLVTINECD